MRTTALLGLALLVSACGPSLKPDKPQTVNDMLDEQERLAYESEQNATPSSADAEDGTLEVCRELGIGFVAYSPLGRGFLTGQIKRPEDLAPDDFRRMNPRFQGENFTRNLDLVARIEELAREKSCTPAQLALAWLLARGPDIVPIPGTRHPKRLEENVGALGIALTADDLRRVDEVAPRGAAAGERYPAGGMAAVGR